MTLSLTASVWLYSVAGNEVTWVASQSVSVGPAVGVVQNSKDRTLQSLVFFNLFTLGAGTLTSYALARRTLKPIQKSYEAQAHFATDASHELRTPLTALKAELQVARKSDLRSKKAMNAMIDSSLAEVDRLQRLTERLLQLAEPVTRPKPQTEASLQEALTAAQKVLQPGILSRKLHIVVPAQDARLAIHTSDLTEILLIILDNACKYSPPKSTVQITCQPKGKVYELDIQDGGPGILAKDIPHIFERFYRGSSSGRQSGFGLGLAVAKNIVNAAGGTIDAKSDRGTTITVRLPRATSV
ncbi:MAG TPA: HAMP domain-containing sensor histidine kinase [Candidatus Saccharimonadales bacterium]|nr:HAMP domain-containing sensor histidine kinase [Candidatus Saccharimonadales bacterium]